MFKPYLHVERLGTDATEGLLDNDRVIVTPKIDGTNACAWCEPDGTLHAGSRKRELSADDDNAGFHAWLTGSQGDEAVALRAYLSANPGKIVYGEWMGSASRFVGAIKDYAEFAHAHLFVFDVFDMSRLDYMPEREWRAELEAAGLSEWAVPIVAELDHPSVDDVMATAQGCTWLLSKSADHPGEGVVCRVDGFRDPYGHSVRGKLVLAEYRQMKSKSKRPRAVGEAERDIVAFYVTESELSKTREKVVTACGAETFDTRSPKMVGMMMSMVWKDLLGECPNWAKRFRNPVVDLSAMKAGCDATVRDYLGLS